jgi:hypothetical protein
MVQLLSLSVLYVVIIVLVIVFIRWFVKTLGRIRDSLERIEMKLMGYDPMTGNPDTIEREIEDRE